MEIPLDAKQWTTTQEFAAPAKLLHRELAAFANASRMPRPPDRPFAFHALTASRARSAETTLPQQKPEHQTHEQRLPAQTLCGHYIYGGLLSAKGSLQMVAHLRSEEGLTEAVVDPCLATASCATADSQETTPVHGVSLSQILASNATIHLAFSG